MPANKEQFRVEVIEDVPRDRVPQVVNDYVLSGAEVKTEQQSDGLNKVVAKFYENARYLASGIRLKKD